MPPFPKAPAPPSPAERREQEARAAAHTQEWARTLAWAEGLSDRDLATVLRLRVPGPAAIAARQVRNGRRRDRQLARAGAHDVRRQTGVR
jgi:hypothetical protein